MKLKINDQTFETPLSMSGDAQDLLWLAQTIITGCSSEGASWCYLNIRTDDDYAKAKEAERQRHERYILAEADRIHAMQK